MTYVVALRPNYEIATMYGHFWCGHLYGRKAVELGYDVIDLEFFNCKQEVLYNETKLKDPVLIAGVCHGNKDIIVGQDNTILFKVGDPVTEEIVKGRHVWMLSCLAGQELLPWMVEHCGAITTMGYKDTFVFVADTFPDPIARYFFESHFTGVIEFLKGKTAGEAFKATIDKFTEFLNDPNVDERIKPYLLHDRDCAVLFGDPNSKIVEGGGDMVKTASVVVYLEKITPEYGRIVFRVLEKDTEIPIKGAKVTVEHAEKPISWEAYTDDQGMAVIDGVEIATYNYKVEKEGYKTATGTITPDMFQ